MAWHGMEWNKQIDYVRLLSNWCPTIFLRKQKENHTHREKRALAYKTNQILVYVRVHFCVQTEISLHNWHCRMVVVRAGVADLKTINQNLTQDNKRQTFFASFHLFSNPFVAWKQQNGPYDPLSQYPWPCYAKPCQWNEHKQCSQLKTFYLFL